MAAMRNDNGSDGNDNGGEKVSGEMKFQMPSRGLGVFYDIKVFKS